MFITKKAALAATMAFAVFSIVPTGYISVAHAKKTCACVKLSSGWHCNPNRKRCYIGLAGQLGAISVWGGTKRPASIQALSKETGGKIKIIPKNPPKVEPSRTEKFLLEVSG